MRRIGGGPTQALSFGRSKAKIYDRKELKTTFADVAGVDEAKAELVEVVDFLKNPKKYQRLGGRIPKGVLLVGPPGTGKTLLARAVAGEADVPFFFLSGSEFVEMFVGVGAARVRDLFEQAKEKAPCIIFIDELDAIGKSRAGPPGLMGGHDEREQTLNQLLAEMDGFDSSKGVIIMAATNRPEVLDPALLRAGRFDRQVVVDRPDVKGREAILQRPRAQRARWPPSVDLRVLAARTPGMAGADLANIINEAALLAARKGKDAVEMADLDEAVDRVIGGLERQEPRALREGARHRRPPRDRPRPGGDVPAHRPTRCTRSPSSRAGWGRSARPISSPWRTATCSPGASWRTASRCSWAGARPRRSSTGRSPPAPTTTSSAPTEMARLMVMQYGMSDKLGPMTFGGGQQSLFLKGSGSPPSGTSARTPRGPSTSETRAIIDRIYDRVRDLMTREEGGADGRRGGAQAARDHRGRPAPAAPRRDPWRSGAMISMRRSTVALPRPLAVALGAFAGAGRLGALERRAASDEQPAPRRAPLRRHRARAPRPSGAALPSGSFAQVAETVAPAVVNINTVTARGGGGRTPVEEFFGDEFFRRFFGDVPRARAAAAEPGLRRHRRPLRHRADQCPRGGAGHRHRGRHLRRQEAQGQAGRASTGKTDLAVLRLQGGGPFPAAPARRLRQDQGRRLGAGHRLALRPAADGDRGHHQRQGPLASARAALRRLPADRRRHQSRQLRRPARQHGGRGGRHQQRHPLALGRQCRHRLRHPRQHGQAHLHRAGGQGQDDARAGSACPSSRSRPSWPRASG